MGDPGGQHPDERAVRVPCTMWDDSRERAVAFSGTGDDLRVALRWRGVEPTCVLSFRYADFTPLSFARPWDLAPAPLRSLAWEQDAKGEMYVRAEAGAVAIADGWRWRGERVWLTRRWMVRGDSPLVGVTLGTRLPTPSGSAAKVTLPGVSYNGNPSAAPERLVPRLAPVTGSVLVVEEHRLPVPGINVEWAAGGRRLALTLLVLPGRIRLPGAGEDLWWTLGGAGSATGIDLLSLSGAMALNGERDSIYAAQNQAVHDPARGYLTLQAGDVLEKTLVLDFGPCVAEGQGFRQLVHCGWDVLRPRADPALTPAETVALKSQALHQRWRAAGPGGFLVATPTREEGNIYGRAPGFLYGWTGQSLRLAWCALALGLTGGDPAWSAKGRAVLTHFAAAPERKEAPGLRPLYYALDEGRWYADAKRQSERFSSRMAGEALANLADCLLLLRRHGQPLDPSWAAALRGGLRFLASPERTNRDGVFPCYFARTGDPADGFTSAAGLPAVVALLRGGEFLADEELQRRALTLLAHYEDLFARTFDQPFSRSTLDAACEDKEAGLYFFLAAYHAFRLTAAPRLAEAARLAAEWAATFVYCWNVDLPADSACARQGLRTAYWPSVSVQNHHLDVFFFPWEVHDLGVRLRVPWLQDLGHGVLQACTQGVARQPGDWGYPTPGEQPEALFQTNWSTTGSGRGGFNPWNPSWIVGMVLQAALRFAHPHLG